jgi:hypothetical protein
MGMIRQHIDQLEARIRNATGITDAQRAELLGLVNAMRTESESIPSDPNAIAKPVGQDNRPLNEMMGEINESVAELEASHPRLAQLTNQVAVVLSNMGI